MSRRHSQTPRGLAAFEDPAKPSKSGRFGRLFDPDDDQLSPEILPKLASSMIGDGPDEDNSIFDDDVDDENRSRLGGDDARPLRITSGYTYLGQFIDHDLTFDPISSLAAQIDPDALLDFRTPRFDLDSLYGAGPDDQPYLYQPDGEKLVEGSGGDVVRMGDRAVIGDPRNDENRIVVQLQHLFIRFHNRVIDLLRGQGITGQRFQRAQQIVRWTYQWIVLHDFLPRILKDVVAAEVQTAAARKQPFALTVKMSNSFGEPFMPVEFAGAAYRFGHSMVRPSYHLNDAEVRLRDGGSGAEGGNRVPIFDLAEPNLNGFRPLLLPGAATPLTIEWKYFFHFEHGGQRPQAKDRATGAVHDVVQPAYRIDTKLVEPLKDLIIPLAVGGPPASLAERNLLRGMRLRLPSGQKMAVSLGVPPLSRKELLLEPGQTDPRDNEIAEERIATLGQVDADAVASSTPLWYYILAEAQTREGNGNLGAVGSLLVGGVFLKLLLADPSSYLNLQPGFNPADALGFPAGAQFQTMADLVAFAQPETIGRLGTLFL
jgi:hypothetical protein